MFKTRTSVNREMKQDVINAIELEIHYATGKHHHSRELSIPQWVDVLRYLQIRLQQAKTDDERKHEMRKIASTAIQCLEGHGVIPRKAHAHASDI